MLPLLLAMLSLPADPVPAVPTLLARVRPLTNVAKSIVNEAIRRSPTIENLVDELRQYNVIVYVELRSSYMSGRGATSIMTSTAEWRILHVALSDRLEPMSRILTLGHELYHVLEIARAAEVRDEASFRAFFARIGYTMGEDSYETKDAYDIETRIRRDLALFKKK